MLNENKIRLMTDISMLEKERSRDLTLVHRYFRGDYIGLHLLRSLLGYTFCWCLGMVLVGMCKVEDIISAMSITDLADYLLGYLTWYIGGLAVYLMITFIVYFVRYRRAARSMKLYLGGLKSLERRYELSDRDREQPGKGVRRS